MNNKTKSFLVVLATAFLLSMSGCSDSSSTPEVELTQESSAQQLEVPPVAPTLN